jgi:hypothetical protein
MSVRLLKNIYLSRFMIAGIKKIIALSLLAVLFISQAGYYFFYTYQQYRVQEEMEKQLFSKIPESLLESFDAGQQGDKIKWIEKGKEFSLNGVMYDVVRINQNNGHIILYCLNDKKEKQLLDDLAKSVERNHDNSKEGKNIGKIIQDEVVFNCDENIICFTAFTIHYSYYKINPITSFKEVNSPPPRV